MEEEGCSDFGVYSSSCARLVIPVIRLFCLRVPGGFTAHQIMMLSLLTRGWKCLWRVPSKRRVRAELPFAG